MGHAPLAGRGRLSKVGMLNELAAETHGWVPPIVAAREAASASAADVERRPAGG